MIQGRTLFSQGFQPLTNQRILLWHFKDSHFMPANPKIFLKAPLAPMYTNFEGERAPKTRNFSIKIFEKVSNFWKILTEKLRVFGARSLSKLVYIGAKGAFRKIFGLVGIKWLSLKCQRKILCLVRGWNPWEKSVRPWTRTNVGAGCASIEEG